MSDLDSLTDSGSSAGLMMESSDFLSDSSTQTFSVKVKGGIYFVTFQILIAVTCQTTVLREDLFLLQKPRINVGQTLAAQPQIFLSFFTLFIFCREVTRLNLSVLGFGTENFTVRKRFYLWFFYPRGIWGGVESRSRAMIVPLVTAAFPPPPAAAEETLYSSWNTWANHGSLF